MIGDDCFLCVQMGFKNTVSGESTNWFQLPVIFDILFLLPYPSIVGKSQSAEE